MTAVCVCRMALPRALPAPPEGRFTTPTVQSAVFSDDFNDGIITNATCVCEALIEVELISASLKSACDLQEGMPRRAE